MMTDDSAKGAATITNLSTSAQIAQSKQVETKNKIWYEKENVDFDCKF